MIQAFEHLLDDHAAGRLSRREAVGGLVALAAALGGVPAPARAASGERPTFEATGLNHVGVRVSDVARSRDFYCRHLGTTVIRDNAPGNCFLRAGDYYVGLFRSANPAFDHVSFTVDGYEPDEAMERLEAAGLEPRRQEDFVYFDDPDGLELQVDSRFGSWPGPPPGGDDPEG